MLDIGNITLFNIINEDLYLGQCSSNSSFRNGQIRWTGHNIGDISVITCLTGFILDGNPVRQCLKSGLWSGSTPKCEGICNINLLQIMKLAE